MEQLEACFTSDHSWTIYDQTSGSHGDLTHDEGQNWRLVVASPKPRQCFLLRKTWDNGSRTYWRLYMVNEDCDQLIMYVRSLTTGHEHGGFNMTFVNESGKLFFAKRAELFPHAMGYCDAVSKNMTWEEYFDWLTGKLTGFAGSFGRMSRQSQAVLANAIGYQHREDAEKTDRKVAELASQVAGALKALVDKDVWDNPMPGLVRRVATRLAGNLILTKLHEAFQACQEADPTIELPTNCLEVRP